MRLKSLTFIFSFVAFSSAFAQSAADCIQEFQSMKGRFDEALGAAEAELNCVTSGNNYRLFTEGPLPPGCEDQGSWDHWHLEAEAGLGRDSFCSMMLRGQDGVTECEAPEVRIDLPANEAQAWRRFLREECGEE